MGDLKKKAVKGVAWSTVQSLSNKSISFVFLIIMARLLLPADYGLVGMLAVFISVAEAFVNCGFGQALVRKQNRTRVDESTVFYFNILASTSCYFIIFLLAPFVGDFYKMPELCPLLRFLALKIVISSFAAVQILQYTIALNFKIPAIVIISCNILSGLIGIYFAFRGMGAWALAIQQVLMALFSTLFYWIVSSWRPLLAFSIDSFKEMFAFGSKLLGASLLNILYSNLSTIFIGKAYSSKDLGLYSKGQEMASYPSGILYGIVSSVTYPLLCTIQSDRDKMTNAYSVIIGATAYVIYPVMAIVCVLSQPIILLLFGDKWLLSSEYLSLLCYPYMIVPICAVNFGLLQVVGRSDLVLRLELITKAMGVIMLLITLPISVKAMCIGTIVNVTLCLFVNTYYTKNYIDISQLKQLSDLFRPFILSAIMATAVFFFITLFDNNLLKLIIGSLFGIVLYLAISYFFKIRELRYCLDFLRRK